MQIGFIVNTCARVSFKSLGNLPVEYVAQVVAASYVAEAFVDSSGMRCSLFLRLLVFSAGFKRFKINLAQVKPSFG